MSGKTMIAKNLNKVSVRIDKNGETTNSQEARKKATIEKKKRFSKDISGQLRTLN